MEKYFKNNNTGTVSIIRNEELLPLYEDNEHYTEIKKSELTPKQEKKAPADKPVEEPTKPEVEK